MDQEPRAWRSAKHRRDEVHPVFIGYAAPDAATAARLLGVAGARLEEKLFPIILQPVLLGAILLEGESTQLPLLRQAQEDTPRRRAGSGAFFFGGVHQRTGEVAERSPSWFGSRWPTTSLPASTTARSRVRRKWTLAQAGSTWCTALGRTNGPRWPTSSGFLESETPFSFPERLPDLIRTPGFFDWERSARIAGGLGQTYARPQQDQDRRRHPRGAFSKVCINALTRVAEVSCARTAGKCNSRHPAPTLSLISEDEARSAIRFPFDKAAKHAVQSRKRQVLIPGGGPLFARSRAAGQALKSSGPSLGRMGPPDLFIRMTNSWDESTTLPTI